MRWNTGTGAGEVTVTDVAGEEHVFAGTPSGEVEAPWIQPNLRYIFRLYTTSPDRSLLKTFIIGKNLPAHPNDPEPEDERPGPTPAGFNRGLQVLPYLIAALFVGLTAAYVKGRNG